jgi:hypothetical protein
MQDKVRELVEQFFHEGWEENANRAPIESRKFGDVFLGPFVTHGAWDMGLMGRMRRMGQRPLAGGGILKF